MECIYERKIDNARRYLSLITTNIMYRPEIADNIDKIKLKEKFKSMGYDMNIQNLIWEEYKEFLKKYVK